MTTDNGAVDFTHKLAPFTLEGITFRRRKVDPGRWAEVLETTAEKEREVGTEGGVTLKVSAEGLHELIKLAIVEDQHADWDRLRAEGLIEWGELISIRQWLWEQQTDRPFIPASTSGTGDGATEASSEAASPSKAGGRKA